MYTLSMGVHYQIVTFLHAMVKSNLFADWDLAIDKILNRDRLLQEFQYVSATAIQRTNGLEAISMFVYIIPSRSHQKKALVHKERI